MNIGSLSIVIMFSCIYLCFPYTISCCFLSVCKHCLCICGSSNILYGKLTTIHIYAILYTPSSLKLFLVLWAIVVLSVICPWVHKQLLVHEIKFSFIIQCLLLTLIFAHSKYVEISSHDSTILSAVNSDHDCTETLAFVIINRILYHTGVVHLGGGSSMYEEALTFDASMIKYSISLLSKHDKKKKMLTRYSLSTN